MHCGAAVTWVQAAHAGRYFRAWVRAASPFSNHPAAAVFENATRRRQYGRAFSRVLGTDKTQRLHTGELRFYLYHRHRSGLNVFGYHRTMNVVKHSS